MAGAQTARAKAEVALAEATKALAREETLRRSHELDVADRHGKIGRLRKQMETATSAAQIAALEHEIAFAEQTISRLEDEELASMERTELHESTAAAAAAALETTTATLAAERARSAALLTHNTAAIAGLEVERAATRALVSESPLSTYDRIGRAKGTGLSEAVDHKCAACQMMVRPQRWNDFFDGAATTEIYTCETCGRMLFYDPRRDAPVPWAAGDRLRAALASAAGPKPAASASPASRIAETA